MRHAIVTQRWFEKVCYRYQQGCGKCAIVTLMVRRVRPIYSNLLKVCHSYSEGWERWPYIPVRLWEMHMRNSYLEGCGRCA